MIHTKSAETARIVEFAKTIRDGVHRRKDITVEIGREKMKNIQNNLKSCSPNNNVYTYSFTQEEVDEIEAALNKKNWLEEVGDLLREVEIMDKEDFIKALAEFIEDLYIDSPKNEHDQGFNDAVQKIYNHVVA